MRSWCFTALLLGIAAPAFAQLSLVNGRTYDGPYNVPLPTVQVVLLDADSTVVAATTSDGSGDYRLLNVPYGTYTLVARYLGFATHREELRVRRPRVTVNIRMQEAATELETVEVTGRRMADSSDVRTSVVQLTPTQVQLIAGATEDIFRALQTLPGVVAASDYSNQLIVRGGNPDQNLIRLDDLELFNPYRADALSSLLNPTLLSDVEFYSGGFPVPFGDRLSSVVQSEMREGGRDGFGGEANLNLVNLNLTLEGPTGFWDGGWVVGARRSYVNYIGDEWKERLNIYNEVAFPDFYDVQGKLVLRPATNHRLTLIGLYLNDALDQVVRSGSTLRGAESNLELDDATTTLAFSGAWHWVPTASLRFKVYGNHYRNVGDGLLSGEMLPMRQRVSGQLNGAETPATPIGDPITFAYDQQFTYTKSTLGATAGWQRGAHLVEVGGGVDMVGNELDLLLDVNETGRLTFAALRSSPNWAGPLVDTLDNVERHQRFHGYVQDKITFSDRFFVQPGVRYDYSALTESGFWSPRVSLSWAVQPRLTWRASAGRYYQTPGYEKLLEQGNVFNLSRFASITTLEAEQATHAVTGLTREFDGGWLAKVEGYYKRYTDLIVQKAEVLTRQVPVYNGSDYLDPNNYEFEEREVYTFVPEGINDAEGEAYGVEVLLEKQPQSDADRWSGWLSYTFARAERERDFLGERRRVPFDYDRRHALNVVSNWRFGNYLRWNLGVTWRYGSGFPYTPPAGFEAVTGSAVGENDEPIIVLMTDPETGYVQVIPKFGGPANVNSARLPAYHRLDLRLTYRTTLQGSPLELYVDAINVYNNQNVLGYRYPVEVIPADPNQPDDLAKPVLLMFEEPIYMFPFLPSIGVSYSF